MPPLEELKEHQGILFDPSTGKTYWSAGEDLPYQETPYTFERATWSGPFKIEIPWPWLNPLGFATAVTAQAVTSLCQIHLRGVELALPGKLSLLLSETNRIVGPFTRTTERLIECYYERLVVERFSAGQLAASIIRRGVRDAMASWQAELLIAIRSGLFQD